MATFIIVSEDKDPLGPGEINAGDDIEVNEGDIFIISATADEDVTFESAGGGNISFSVEFAQSNSNNLEVKIEQGLAPSISIADNVDLSDIQIDAGEADAANLSIGDGVTLQEFRGSQNSSNTIEIGDDFVSRRIRAGNGDDQITIGDRAQIDRLRLARGDDEVTIGDNFVGDSIKLAAGDDFIRLGANANINEIDGGSGNDVLNTQSPDIPVRRFETVNVVCFVRGTRIATQSGQVCIEHLREGDLVVTADHGLQPIRWIGSSVVDGWDRLAPILIPKGTLANERDLRVSPQHRMLIRQLSTELYFGTNEVLVPAKHLIELSSIRRAPCDNVQYFHMLFDQHEIVYSEGAPSESFHPGAVGMSSFDQKVREEIFLLFPELRQGANAYGTAARRSLKRYEASVLNRF